MQRMSRSRPPQTPEMHERGFERLSGRKLPSQFSPGMQGPWKASPGASYPSGTSHYPSGGTYTSSSTAYDNPFDDPSDRGSPFTAGSSKPAATGRGMPPRDEEEKMRPGPARTPVFHQGPFSQPQLAAPSAPLMPEQSAPSPRPSILRAPPSVDGSRGSRFTEDLV